MTPKYRSIRLKSWVTQVLVIFLFSGFSFAQTLDNTSSNFWRNVQFGGGIGLNFANGFFSGALMPNALYRINPYVSAGLGLNFQYSSQRDVFKSTVVGGSIIGLFNPIRDLQLSTEFEQLYLSQDFDERFVDNIDDNYWYPALFVGVGYRTQNVTFGIRYDVLYDRNRSIQPEAWMPFVRFWF